MSTHSQQLYEYRQLDDSQREIRLLKILPGRFDDELLLEIFHTAFVAPKEPASDTRSSLKEIQTGLSRSWRVYQNLEGRYFFWNKVENITQWYHPNPEVESSLYDCPAVLDPYPNFELKYEGKYIEVAMLPTSSTCVR